MRAALAAKGVDIHTLSLADTAEFGILRLIVADPAAGKAALEEAGYIAKLTEVVAVEVPDDAGGLANILAKADEARLGIEYMYAFSTAVPASALSSSSASANQTIMQSRNCRDTVSMWLRRWHC